MKTYFQALYQSFGSPALYAQVIYRWTGSGLRYLIVLAALTSFLICAYSAYQLHGFAQEKLPSLVQQMPEITITKGIATSKVQQPHIIKDADQKPLAIIDTTVEDGKDLPDEKGTIFMARSYMLLKQNDTEYKRFDYKEFGTRTLVINKDKVTSFFAKASYLVFVFFPVILASQWIILVVMAIMAATLSYVVTAYMPEEYNFETRMRMAVIAITPPLIANKLLTTFSDYYLGFWVIVILWVLHFYLMILATRYHLKNNPLDAL